jgi:hypothetical protein
MQTRLWWRLWRGLADSIFGGSLESCGRFCVGTFGGNLASVAVKVFSHLIYIIKKFYKCCTFTAIRKDNSAILHYYSTQKRFILVNFDGSYVSDINKQRLCVGLFRLFLTSFVCVYVDSIVKIAPISSMHSDNFK